MPETLISAELVGPTRARSGRPTGDVFGPFPTLFPVGRRSSLALGSFSLSIRGSERGKDTQMEVTLITFNVLADVARTHPMSPWHARVPVWDERKVLCVQALHQAQPSILGLQEVMPHQFDFFSSAPP